MLPAATLNHNESKLLFGVLEYLKGLDLQNVESRKVFFELLNNVCNIDDEFMRWLSKRIAKRHDNIMKAIISQRGKARGFRTVKEPMTHQAFYDMWHNFNSTVERRNGRDQIKMNEMEFKKKFKALIVPANIRVRVCHQ